MANVFSKGSVCSVNSTVRAQFQFFNKLHGKSFRPFVSAPSTQGFNKRSAPLRFWLPSFDILTLQAAYNAFCPSHQQPKNCCAKVLWEGKQNRFNAPKARIVTIWWHHRQKCRTGANKSTSRQWLVQEMTWVWGALTMWSLLVLVHCYIGSVYIYTEVAS